MRRPNTLELFLLEFTIFFSLWLIYPYLATLLSALFSIICFFLLLFTWIAERIEPSRVPGWYFSYMWVSVLAPLVAAAAYQLINWAA